MKTKNFLPKHMPSNQVYTSFKAVALLITCTALMPLAHAQKTLQSFTLEPQKNIVIAVEKLDELNNFQLTQPDATVILLKNVSRFEEGDFNFDNAVDLRVIHIDGKNTRDEILLYQPAAKKYARLTPSKALQSQMVCDGLMNVQIVKTSTKEITTPMLSSSCVIDRAQNVNFDYLQYDPQGELTLARQYVYENIALPDALLPYTDLPWGITHKMITYAAPNNAATPQPVFMYRTSQAFEPIIFKALHTKLTLHEAPQADSPSTLTLQQGQVCRLLNLQGNWLELGCPNAQGVMQQGWLAWDKALQDATEQNRPFMITEAPSAKLY